MDDVIASEANQSPDVSTAQPVIASATKQSRKRLLAITFVILLAFGLRVWAAWQLPVDFDEPVYLEGAYDYAELIRTGDWQGLIDYDKVMEHPPLTRLLYASVLLLSERGLNWEQALLTSRLVSVVLGTLGVALVAIIDPLAGLLLAIQTVAVKYTSQAYLESTALFTALLALFAMLRSRRLGDGWFWLSAAALGLTAAAKYSYFPILFVILYIAWWEKRYRSPLLGAYLGVALISFLVFDPHLWNNPFQRLIDSLLFHQQYALGEHVQEVGYPWNKPIFWVSRSQGYIWHPEVFFYMGFDGLIFLASFYGAYVDWKNRRWVVVCLLTGMLFLLLWPTKWPQYTLVVIPAFCLAASSALGDIYRRLKEQDTYWEWFGNMFPRPSRRYITCGGLLILVFLLAVAVNTGILTYNRLSWSSLNTGNSPLPSDIVNDLLTLPDGRMLIATEVGAAIWQAAGEDDLQDQWQIFTPANSGLPNGRVLSLAREEDGLLWFGTAAGLASFDGQSWQVYRAADLGLKSDQINDLAIEQGRLWVATQAGTAVYDGASWASYTIENSALTSNAVFALAVQPLTQGNLVWFGTLNGVVSYNTQRDAWMPASSEQESWGVGGVADLLVDSSNRLWVATLGGGISVWDGSNWTHFRTSNSDLPYNTVTEVEEVEADMFWIATSLPAEAGGVVSHLADQEWITYKPIFSGYSGAETMTIARDGLGRLWFGTRTAGIDIYEERR
jgi:hypothetical protein